VELNRARAGFMEGSFIRADWAEGSLCLVGEVFSWSSMDNYLNGVMLVKIGYRY
jgi:hypothetical protein